MNIELRAELEPAPSEHSEDQPEEEAEMCPVLSRLLRETDERQATREASAQDERESHEVAAPDKDNVEIGMEVLGAVERDTTATLQETPPSRHSNLSE